MFVFFSNEQLKLLQCGWKLLLVFHMKSPYLGEEEDNFLQKKNGGSFIVLHALHCTCISLETQGLKKKGF